MAAQEIPTPKTPEEIISTLDAFAQSRGDNFSIKVMRRGSLSAATLPKFIAHLEQAKLSHITLPEPWLQMLAGGGMYTIQVFPPDNGVALGSFVIAPIGGDEKEIDPSVVQSPHWTGPGVITFPTQIVRKTQPVTLTGVPVGGQNQNPTSVSVTLPGRDPREEEYARREAALIEKQHQMELDALKRQADEKYSNLERKLNEAIAALSSRPQVVEAPKVDSLLEKLLPAFLPVITQFITESREAKKEALAMQLKLQESLASRPVIAPEIKEILEKSQASASEQAKMMGSVYEAMGNMSRNMIQTIASIADLQLGNRGGGQEEGFNWNVFLKGAMEAIGGVVARVEASKAAQLQHQGPVVTQPQLPPKPPIQPVKPTPIGQPIPTPVTQVPTEVPSTPPTATSTQETKKMDEEEDDTEEYDPNDDPRSHKEQIRDAILAKMDPVELANGVLDVLPSDPELQALLGNQSALQAWGLAELGLGFLTDSGNQAYLKNVFDLIQKGAAERAAQG